MTKNNYLVFFARSDESPIPGSERADRGGFGAARSSSDGHRPADRRRDSGGTAHCQEVTRG